MNVPFQHQGLNPFDNALDRILAEIALSVQLSPSLHEKADGRYSAVRAHLEASSVFAGQIEHFYPQGSMAIDATISNRGTDDEYDLDIVSQLGGRFRAMAPLAILIELERALADYPVTKVLRQTRCITLCYADRMHLDVTPALRIYDRRERESLITHGKGPHPGADDRFVDMNAYGFANWYRERTPLEIRLARAFRDHWLGLDSALHAEAEVDEVPDQTDFPVKNTATLALQLLKRFRNICYVDYDGRMPPSVMLSYFAGMAATPDMSLSDMLIRQARRIVRAIEEANLYGRLLHVSNPICPDDVFTDRWPADRRQQDGFAQHLRQLISGLEIAKRGEMMPDRLMEWLRTAFGARVVTKAADRMAEAVGQAVQGANQSYTRRGGLLFPAAGLAAAPAIAQARPHTFYGIKI